jgi:hypothetical protein
VIQPDFSDLPPLYQEKWKQLLAEIDDMRRQSAIEDVKFLRQFRRTVIQNAILRDEEPVGLDAIDELLEILIGRLT